MPSYLVETYLARGQAGERAARERRARSAAEELTQERTRVRFERSIHVPEDEICFFVFDAPSGRDAALAAQRAGLDPVPRRRGDLVHRRRRNEKAVARCRPRWCGRLTTVALATPSQGQSSSIVALGALQTDVAFNTGLTMRTDGLAWGDTKYAGDQLPEFLMRLRAAGVTNLGLWLNLHPAVSAKFGMMPVGLLHSPEVVTQTATFAPGAASGWHSHPGYLTGTVVSGQVVRYGTDCTQRDLHGGPDVLRNRSTDVHRQEPKRDGPGSRQRDLRRPRRHADDGAPRRQATAQRPARSDPTRRRDRPRGGEGERALPSSRSSWSPRRRGRVAAAFARADGDPASDSLLVQNVFVPYRSPSPAVSAALAQAADDVYAHGDRVKVAVIYEPSDLGSIPSFSATPPSTHASSGSSSRSGTSARCSS